MRRRELLKSAATIPILSLDFEQSIEDRYPEKIGDFVRDGYFETEDRERSRVEYVHIEHGYERIFVKIHRPSDAFEIHQHGSMALSYHLDNEKEVKMMLYKLARETTLMKRSEIDAV
jgi:hypothetical protein